MKKVSLKSIAIGAGLAAVGGYLAGILTAKKSGSETREDIKNTVKSGKEAGEKQLKEVVDDLNELIDKAKDQGSDLRGKAKEEAADLVDKAKVAKDKAHEVLNAVRSGAADDKDLNMAVTNATRSLKHLKEYLKK